MNDALQPRCPPRPRGDDGVLEPFGEDPPAAEPCGAEKAPRDEVQFDPLARELWRNLGDDGVKKAAYRGG
jgi:hypothetical protein